jgi:hypothetical protein
MAGADPPPRGGCQSRPSTVGRLRAPPAQLRLPVGAPATDSPLPACPVVAARFARAGWFAVLAGRRES